MFNKTYSKIKTFIKENYKTLLVLLISYLVFTFPLPYYIYTSGGTININDRIQIDKEYQSKGSFNFAYVTELHATIPTYLLSYVMNDWKLEKVEEYTLSEEETMNDVMLRDKLSLQEANQDAVFLAYEKAGKKVLKKEAHHYVIYVMEDAKTDLKVGMEILSVNGKKLETVDQYRALIEKLEVGDELNLTVKYNGKTQEKKVMISVLEGKKLTGISIITLYDYETEPNLTLKFHANESGPSGGLMLTLAIYNKLIDEDLTKGYQIVGTGTIDKEGNVGEIGGVKYKLKGAVKSKADIFLVPYGENYEECMKLKKEKEYNIDIVGVKTLDDAIEYLKNRKQKE